MGESEWINRLSRAIDQAEAVISGIRPEQATLPTPCRSWDVRALVNHLVHDLQQFAAMANGASYAKDDSDVIDNWLGAYRAAATTLLETWSREGALDLHPLPGGERAPARRVRERRGADVERGGHRARRAGEVRLLPDLPEPSAAHGRGRVGRRRSPARCDRAALGDELHHAERPHRQHRHGRDLLPESDAALRHRLVQRRDDHEWNPQLLEDRAPLR